jgi:PAS domain-containing protein
MLKLMTTWLGASMSNILSEDKHFHPEQRASFEELQQQSDSLFADQATFKLLDSVPSLLAILNPQRQIVFANQPLLELVGVEEASRFIGRRPGEVFTCEHSADSSLGCGGSEACSTCGAALALLDAEAGQPQVAECRMTRMLSGQLVAMEFEVRATPLVFKGGNFTVFALTDVSHQKWRNLMEKLFFHDVLNVAGTIQGFAELLQDYNLQDKHEIYALIRSASQQVVDQIQAFRTLSAAEKRELKINFEWLSAHKFLVGLADVYRYHDAVAERVLEVELPDADFIFLSDRVLLARILGNMLLNAFEATTQHQTVKIGCSRSADEVRFFVQNPGVIPRQIQLQIFQRSFSTKGPGRGLGTYGLRLLSGYLRGKVDFVSNDDQGTIFSASFPLDGGSVV